MACPADQNLPLDGSVQLPLPSSYFHNQIETTSRLTDCHHGAPSGLWPQKAGRRARANHWYTSSLPKIATNCWPTLCS
jgi:hypothetical protein